MIKLIFQKYATRLAGKMVPLHSVVTRISLQKKVSRSGQTYASYVFEVVEELSPEQSELAKEYSRQFLTALETAEAKPVKRSANTVLKIVRFCDTFSKPCKLWTTGLFHR